MEPLSRRIRQRRRHAAPLAWGLLQENREKQVIHGTVIMYRLERTAPALHSAGMVHRVDTVNREVAVFVNGELLTFDVPVGCAILLHGERVKLRMVQPRDWARIAYARQGRLLVAQTIELQPDAASRGAVCDSSWPTESAG